MIVFQEIHLHVIDLAHPRSVFQFTQEFREQFNCLDALVSISYTTLFKVVLGQCKNIFTFECKKYLINDKINDFIQKVFVFW